MKKKRSRSSSTSSSSSDDSSSSSSSSSYSSSTDEEEKKRKRKRRKLSKNLKKKSRKLKRKEKKKLKKVHQKEKKKLKKAASKKEQRRKVNILDDIDDDDSAVLPGPSVEVAREASKTRAPMTKEEWEKQQSRITRVTDPDTGRQRLIKGDGEIIEECVSRSRHEAINRAATKGDGKSFQAGISSLLSKKKSV